MKRRLPLSPILQVAVLALVLVNASPATAQPSRLRIDYTVTIDNPGTQLFHVATEIKDIRAPYLELSLPTWSPGWYTIENYAKNILRLKITDSKGGRLPFTLTRKQTWRVETANINSLRIDFDYRADILALNQARISTDFAFFTGIQLFLMPEGHRNEPSTVHFKIPEGWKIASALRETSDSKTFTASDYDTLVDSPTEMGSFDVTRFEVEGKPHFFVSTPAGAFSKEKSSRFAELLAKIATAQSAIFGGLPYEKYVYFYFFLRPESNAGGALEHLSSHVAFAGSGQVATPEMMAGTASHEFFHLWNVKRIRPAEMWPYDYSRDDETPLLWVSEGFTNYYGGLALYRAGLRSKESFLLGVGRAISDIEGNDARNYISPANSSTSTWLGYDTPVAFGISYYTQGQNLGGLLDLSILHDTGGKTRLDEVMRELYTGFYKKNRGFSTQDLIGVINRITGSDYREFFRRYVAGVEVPDYDRILGYAGYRLDKSTRKTVSIGWDLRFGPDGARVHRVQPDSPAAKAGIAAGDIILTIDGQEPRRSVLTEKTDQTVKVGLKRQGEQKTVDMLVESQETIGYRVVEVEHPSADQLKVREAWLRQDK